MSGVDAQRRRLLLAAALAGPGAAWAIPFPKRAVRIVVPYSVGIGPDVVARALAAQLQQQWNQPVRVDNRPGASGIVAFGEVRRTPADGHTLFLADTATLSVNPLLHASLPYDPERDLLPLSLLFRATFVLWAGAGNRHASLAELLQAARRQPGSVTYATLGNGHASHVAVESLAHAADLDLLQVPFKDTGSLLTAVAAGAVDFTAIGINTVAGLWAAGKLRPLAVGARQRLPRHPEIPTLAEAGGPDVVMHPWAALVTVAGTPAAVAGRLQQSVTRALAHADVQRMADQAGFELTPSSPEAVRERMAQDRVLYRPLVESGRVPRT